MYRRVLLAVVAASVVGGSALAAAARRPPMEAEQVLFVIDDSSSMADVAVGPDGLATTRWDLVQRAYPEWMKSLGPDVLVGAISVGGACGAAPAIRLEIGTKPQRISSALAGIGPSGQTNLNAALLAAPSFFDPDLHGRKRLVVLSDGLNTCVPVESTCDIARRLHSDHAISIDVVAFITDPQMADELRCVTTSTGGTFAAPNTYDELVSIALSGVNVWPYITLITGFLTLMFSAEILYRHGHHALGWDAVQAALTGGMFMMFGTLALYLTLFARAGAAAAALAGCLLLAVLVLMARRRDPAQQPAKPKPWTLAGIFVLAVLWAQPASAAVPSCEKIAKRDPRYYHILAIDASGSVVKYFESMKTLLLCYAQMYAAPGEEMTLVVFASDETGTPKELGTFKIPQNGSTDALASLLDDLRIQRPRATRTYFQPLAEFINRLLVKVRLDPIVLVLSDGVSDAYSDAAAGRISFQEVPFESFAKRGLYSAPGMANWKVAIQGGEGIDLTMLFQRPLRIRAESARPRRLAPALDPCLMDPDLVVETDDTVTLRPDWIPFTGIRRGSLTLRASNDCGVTRFRSFSVELIEDKKTTVLARFDNTTIGPKPRAFNMPLARQATATHKEATVRVILRQAEMTRTIYPRQPEVIALNEVDYLSEYALAGMAAAATLVTTVALFAIAGRRRRARRRNAPSIVKSLDGPGVPLYPNAPELIGDADVATIGVAGCPAGAVFGSIQYTGADNEFLVRPASGFQVRLNGIDGAGRYRLGQQIEFTRVHDGATFEVRLHGGVKRDMGWRTSPAASVAVELGSAFQGFDGVIATGAHGGPRTGGDGYI